MEKVYSLEIIPSESWIESLQLDTSIGDMGSPGYCNFTWKNKNYIEEDIIKLLLCQNKENFSLS